MIATYFSNLKYQNCLLKLNFSKYMYRLHVHIKYLKYVHFLLRYNIIIYHLTHLLLYTLYFHQRFLDKLIFEIFLPFYIYEQFHEPLPEYLRFYYYFRRGKPFIYPIINASWIIFPELIIIIISYIYFHRSCCTITPINIKCVCC